MESAVRGMVADLDRHSAYLDADEYQEIRISTSGRYTGVGLEVSLADGRLVVVSPIDGSPAARAGVEAGDQILEIDAVTVTEESLDDTVERLRGRAGTTCLYSRAAVWLRRPAELRPDAAQHPGRQRSPRADQWRHRLPAPEPVHRFDTNGRRRRDSRTSFRCRDRPGRICVAWCSTSAIIPAAS